MTATATPETEPDTKRTRAVGATRLGYGVIAAAIALVAAASGQVLQFFPGLKADPRERAGADLEVFVVEPGVSYQDWLGRTSGSQRCGETVRTGSSAPLPAPPRCRRRIAPSTWAGADTSCTYA